MSIHLCLVSEQPVPSLTPLLDPALAVRNVVLVHTPERADHARWLTAALGNHGIAATLHRLADGYDLAGLRRELSALAARHPEGVVANITGGTKLMTIAVWETFDRPGDRLYYIDIRRDSIRWLRPEAPEQPVADRIRLEAYVVAHGLRIHPKRPLRRDPPPPASIQEARRRAVLLGSSRRRYDSDGGEWLEELVFDELGTLAGQDRKIQDVARQFVIDDNAPNDERVTNEIDVAVLRDNTLHLVECKTGQAGKGGAASDSIYKLSQLVDALGGLRGKGIFVSSEPVSGPIKARARQLRIMVIDRSAFGNLGRALNMALAARPAI